MLAAFALIAGVQAQATPVWQGSGACRLLVYGDSLAAGWSAPPPAGWQQAKIGTPGARATDLAAEAAASIAATRPHAMLIFAGSNDARDAALWPWGNHVANGANAMAAMAAAGQAKGVRVVVADLLPPGRQPWWRALLIGARQGRAMTAMMARLDLPADTQRLPVAQLLAGRSGVNPAMRSDHLHYSAAGYARLAIGLAPLLQDACDLGVG